MKNKHNRCILKEWKISNYARDFDTHTQTNKQKKNRKLNISAVQRALEARYRINRLIFNLSGGQQKPPEGKIHKAVCLLSGSSWPLYVRVCVFWVRLSAAAVGY